MKAFYNYFNFDLKIFTLIKYEQIVHKLFEREVLKAFNSQIKMKFLKFS